MYFEGQHPINIMLNKTLFHAEKSAHQQTSWTSRRYCLAQNQARRTQYCGRGWIRTLSSVLTTSTGTLANRGRSQPGEHGASPGFREGLNSHHRRRHCFSRCSAAPRQVISVSGCPFCCSYLYQLANRQLRKAHLFCVTCALNQTSLSF